LLACAFLGVGSHLALDALNTYRVRPLLPFDPRWWYGDAAVIVDPWLWLVLGAGATLGATRTRASDLGWLLVAAATAFVMLRSGHVPTPALAGWACAMAAILAARFGWLPRPPRRAAACAGVVLAALYVGAAFATAAAARQRALTAIEALLPAGARIDAASVTPLPAVPWRHECLVVHEGHVRRVRVDLLTGATSFGPPLAQRLDDPVLERVRMTQRLRAWRTFARVPYVARSGTTVIVGDLRYGYAPAERDWSSLEIAVD